jgi:hypothetical protein
MPERQERKRAPPPSNRNNPEHASRTEEQLEDVVQRHPRRLQEQARLLSDNRREITSIDEEQAAARDAIASVTIPGEGDLRTLFQQILSELGADSNTAIIIHESVPISANEATAVGLTDPNYIPPEPANPQASQPRIAHINTARLRALARESRPTLAPGSSNPQLDELSGTVEDLLALEAEGEDLNGNDLDDDDDGDGDTVELDPELECSDTEADVEDEDEETEHDSERLNLPRFSRFPQDREGRIASTADIPIHQTLTPLSELAYALEIHLRPILGPHSIHPYLIPGTRHFAVYDTEIDEGHTNLFLLQGALMEVATTQFRYEGRICGRSLHSPWAVLRQVLENRTRWPAIQFSLEYRDGLFVVERRWEGSHGGVWRSRTDGFRIEDRGHAWGA